MHEPTDLARLAAGIPVAILLPLCLPRVSGMPRLATAIAAAGAALVTAPLLPDGAAWIGLLGSPAIVLATTSRTPAREEPNTPKIRDGLLVVALALMLTAACLVALDWDSAWSAVRTTIDRNSFIVVAGGALAAVFLGGPLVAWVLSPFADALVDQGKVPPDEEKEKEKDAISIRSLKHAGTLIGWLERALFFAFLVAGQPQAAAVALAAKSFARFPSLSKHQEGFAEYFLIGTLASLVVALAAAIAVRACLGLSAF